MSNLPDTVSPTWMNTSRPLRPGRWSLLLGAALVLLAAGWAAGLRAQWRPADLQAAALADGQQRLSQAGFGWASLQVEDARLRLSGTAPDRVSLEALRRDAVALLDPLTGVLGVFRGIDIELAPGAAAPQAERAPAGEAAAAVTAGTAPAAAALVTPTADPSTPTPVPATACERTLRRAFSQTVIRFSPDSSSLEAPALRAMTQLATAARGCPDWAVEVRAGADGDNLPADDAQLVQRRINTAREALRAAGLPATQLADGRPTPASTLRRLDFGAIPLAR